MDDDFFIFISGDFLPAVEGLKSKHESAAAGRRIWSNCPEGRVSRHGPSRAGHLIESNG